jgi:hypothetical protein
VLSPLPSQLLTLLPPRPAPPPPYTHRYDYSAVGGIAVENLEAIHALHPERPILNTEACTLNSLTQGWQTAVLYMVDIIADLNHWVSAWCFWNHVLLTGSQYPWARGGPNHDNTTDFGDPLLFDFDASGSQQLLRQPSYYVIGQLSRYVRPGSTVLACGGSGTASSPADYEALRLYATGQPAQASGLPLLASAFLSADGQEVIVVVANANDEQVHFKLADGTGRAAQAAIPAKAVQTYSWAA